MTPTDGRTRSAFARRLAAPALLLALALPAAGADVASADAASADAASGSAETAAGSEGAVPAPERIDALVAELEDPARRAALIERLELLAGAGAASAAADEAPAPQDLVAAGEELVTALVEEVRGVDPAWVLRNALLSLGILLVAWLGRRVARAVLRAIAGRLVGWIRRSDGIDFARERLRDAPDQLFEGLPYRLVDLALLVFTTVAILDLWEVSVVDWLRTLAGGDLARRGITAAGLGLATMIVWVISDAVIDGIFRLRTRGHLDPRRRSRVHTLAPLARGVSRVLVGGTGLLMVLSALGIDVTPLLASAGILGLAIGFGAQSLIKDLLVGAFLVLEDACSVDDWVEIGGHAGTVEFMGLRTMRLRDLSGTVHYLPYSEVGTVRNYTKQYAYAWLDVPVDYDVDLDEVFAIVDAVGREIGDDPDFRAAVLEPPHIFGVNDFGERGPVVTVRMKTVALERWSVGREYRRRLKRRFDAEGIAIPFPRTRIDVGDAAAAPRPSEGAADDDRPRAALAASR
jgi:small-conductance mechanosensitive channel